MCGLLGVAISSYLMKSPIRTNLPFAPPSAGSTIIGRDALLAPADVCPGDRSMTASPAAERQAMTCLVNWARTRDGLAALASNARLTSAAGDKLLADVSCDELSDTPCGTPFIREFKQSGYLTDATTYQVGENVAWGTGALGSARAIMADWLHSPGHLANILNPSYRQMGLAYLDSARFLGAADAHLWANDFGSRTRA